ncbi:DUF697 domain-containing protein [Thiorhodococcus mannitoliphagus]|uniref:DUF697 domain-containing protein n=1 Tax=Thiorhodococcus mannitoliphagus TaxID=329406 RepID=A0A6P1DYR5_9GAMM|nr:GTPase [Thiorhodococcus mannitoliphagus]NEX22223.1 DUF697 domain-containing protein [Thiorhodococcus mannitoliphagus]
MSASDASSRSDRWRGLKDAILSPQVDRASLEDALHAARARSSLPVVWLIGKTQAGKTSIIRALTGSEQAEIGTGFQPCTATARLYDFPPEAPVVRFLDTRGLAEVDYDPGEDIRFCESRAHLLLAVMKASDQDQDAVLEVVRSVRARHPEWPLVIAQTGLHELYAADAEHPLPYPFTQTSWSATLPQDLARALAAQRERAADLPGKVPARWVPVDLTLPEDGYEPQDYGLEALWEAIDRVSALRLQWLLGQDAGVKDVFAQAAHPHILGYALAAAAMGAFPVVDLAAVPAIQAKMLQSLAAIYAQRWDRQSKLEFLGLLGSGVALAYAARYVGRAALKLVPYLGQTLGAVWGATASGGTTYALGKAAAYYFHRRTLGLETDARVLRRVFDEQCSQGSEIVRARFKSGKT